MSKLTNTPDDKPAKKKPTAAKKTRKTSAAASKTPKKTKSTKTKITEKKEPVAPIPVEDEATSAPLGEPKPALSIDLDHLDELDPNPPNVFETETDQESLSRLMGVYQIWWNWAHFELSIISPFIPATEPCVMIYPEELTSMVDHEFVYPICDYGNKLSTSKGPEMYSAGMSMCKLYYTIEKMIFILIERLKSTGVSTETEIQIAFDGHELAQRKAFESVINLSYNVVVTNFDPGAWGERYLEIVKNLADKGYGYPAEAPRDIYRHMPGSGSRVAKR